MKMAYSESRSLLRSDIPRVSKKPTNIETSSSEDWSSSYSGSSYSDHSSDDSYTVEWESHVSRDGSLFYLEYNIQPMPKTPNVVGAPEKSHSIFPWRNDLKRTSMRRSKKPGIRFRSLINGKRKTHENVMKKKLTTSARKAILGNRNEATSTERDHTTKVKFNESAEGEVKEITVFLDPSRRLRYGRRTSVAEALLGVSVCPFPDSSRIMIAGYMPNSEISQDKAIKVGDWLKAINKQEINVENFELMLLSFTQPTYIKLNLQRIAVEEPPQNHPNIAKVTNTSEYVDTLKSFFPINRHDERDKSPIFSLLLLSLRDLGEHSSDGEDVIFSYPPRQSNYLYRIRGTFLTLNSLFRECTFNSKPRISCITIQAVEYYVSYHSTKDVLLLSSVPAKRTSFQDAKFKFDTLVRCLEVSANSLTHAFYTTNYTQSDSDDDSQNNEELRNYAIDNICAITKLLYSLSHPWNTRFESILKEPIAVTMPTEGQIRIEDTLNEMEAMDYREWNDEPLKSHREFYILGSALYYRKYLLASHLPTSDLLDVEAFLRTNGIYLLIENKPVRELIVWREIYPKSVSQMNFANGMKPRRPSRWFLAIIARNQLMLAVILESRHHTDANEPSSSSSAYDVISPSRFYIEEIQDTLDHLLSCGIDNLANTWLNANKKPEVILFKDENSANPAHEVSSSSGSQGGASHSTRSTVGANDGHASNTKIPEIISILKRRNTSTENVNDNLRLAVPSTSAAGKNSPSLHSQTYSDSSLQKFDDVDDDDSDSSWDDFDGSQRSNSAFDMSDLASTLYNKISEAQPAIVTSGDENVLYYYVEIESGEGMILAPPSTHPINVILFAFQKASLLIHSILQNSLRFRHLLSQEASTHTMSRSLVAIREHGVLISDELTGYPKFWVIGRLFTDPPKELYICHRADVPQNLVEIEFRLSLITDVK